jgi:hypothetical protein
MFRVAKVVPGDFELKQFKVENRTQDEKVSVSPGQEMKVEIVFERLNDPHPTFPVLLSYVCESRETDQRPKGSHTVISVHRVNCRPGTGLRELTVMVPAPSDKEADFLEKYHLGRYFILVIHQSGSEIASRRIELE